MSKNEELQMSDWRLPPKIESSCPLSFYSIHGNCRQNYAWQDKQVAQACFTQFETLRQHHSRHNLDSIELYFVCHIATGSLIYPGTGDTTAT